MNEQGLAPDNSQQKRLMTVAEVAQATGLSQRTVYSMIRNRELPAVRFRSAIRLLWDDVLEACRDEGSRR